MTVLPAPKASAATKMQFACSLLAGQIYRRHEQMDDDHIAKEIHPGGTRQSNSGTGTAGPQVLANSVPSPAKMTPSEFASHLPGVLHTDIRPHDSMTYHAISRDSSKGPLLLMHEVSEDETTVIPGTI